AVTVLGNERVTQGGNVKRSRARPASQKKKALG
ncbi:MAG TPA: ribosome assembly RNA-binding protein YhbY, partial [Cupriavidus sp.]|nr:ribosome assembly RNA-binding protein YhbY [Cupriavidus sp.]